MSVTDAERAFYESVIAEPEGKSLQDLRYAYFLAALDGGLPTPNPSPVEVPEGIDATGTPSVSTYLRGDGRWATPPNTTYPAITPEQAQEGTIAIARIISPKVLADEIDRRISEAQFIDGVVTEDLLPGMPPGIYIVEPS